MRNYTIEDEFIDACSCCGEELRYDEQTWCGECLRHIGADTNLPPWERSFDILPGLKSRDSFSGIRR